MARADGLSNRMFFRAAYLILVAALTTPAQSFESASVKQNRSGGPGGARRILPGGRIEITNMTLQAIIRDAYDLRDFQIAGPAWLNTDRFDIAAKANGETPARVLKIMLQSLLAERFQMTAHRETRELPIYVLTVAKGGPKFHEAAAEEHALAAGPGNITDRGATMAMFIRQLASNVDRAVIDRTGLTGSYDLDLKWTPDLKAPTDDNAPSIFTAIQEQLGLKLASEKGPVEILVIERVERLPISN